MRARRRLGESGTAAVEFAMVVPVFVLMLYGALELGHYAFANLALVDAAREGTRYAIVHGGTSASPADQGAITTFVRSRITLLDPAQVAVTASFTPNNQPGSTVQVAVSYPYVPFMPSFGYLTARTLSSSAQMSIAQ